MYKRQLSTLSLRRATKTLVILPKKFNNFYPRSPCGERPTKHAQATNNQPISIHALLAESDQPTTSRNNKHNVFLSTLSLRRATGILVFCGPQGSDFYPRSPCGERRDRAYLTRKAKPISIHALLAESDSCMILTQRFFEYFYPRSPCGERRKSSSE